MANKLLFKLPVLSYAIKRETNAMMLIHTCSYTFYKDVIDRVTIHRLQTACHAFETLACWAKQASSFPKHIHFICVRDSKSIQYLLLIHYCAMSIAVWYWDNLIAMIRYLRSDAFLGLKSLIWRYMAVIEFDFRGARSPRKGGFIKVWISKSQPASVAVNSVFLKCDTISAFNSQYPAGYDQKRKTTSQVYDRKQ